MKHIFIYILFTAVFVSVINVTHAQVNTETIVEDKNIGYENKYLKLYKEGKISTTPSFGGRIQDIVFCYNDGVRWTRVGPPRGGDYIWSPSVTKTYEYGPPYHSGQYILGLFAPYYFCLVSPNPLVIFPGILMTMIGTSI